MRIPSLQSLSAPWIDLETNETVNVE